MAIVLYGHRKIGSGISIASVEASDARCAFVSKFGASTAVVDEPVADLCHADTRCLWGYLVSYDRSIVMKRPLTLENTAFCSSEGYGFVMFCRGVSTVVTVHPSRFCIALPGRTTSS